MSRKLLLWKIERQLILEEVEQLLYMGYRSDDLQQISAGMEIAKQRFAKITWINFADKMLQTIIEAFYVIGGKDEQAISKLIGVFWIDDTEGN